MRALVLGPNLKRLASVLADDEVMSTEQRIDVDVVRKCRPEMIVSYGYRFIVRDDVIDAVAGSAVNLHISVLPWNRGADPNFWSWMENTPKGVSLHWMTTTLDGGDLVAQRVVELSPRKTLRSSYERLQDEMVHLFGAEWPLLRTGGAPRHPQSPGGSFHRSADKDRYWAELELGWDTPCETVAELGQRHGLWLRPSSSDG